MKPYPQSLENPRGFTLIEVLLAVAVFAVVLAAIHTVFFAALQLRNKTVATLEQTRPLQQAIDIIRRDLAGIVLPGGVMTGELITSSNQWTLAGHIRPDFFTTTGHLDDNEPWAEVQKVSYFLLDSTNRALGKDLVRCVTRNLLPVSEEEFTDQWLMGGVEDMVFLFYDGTSWQEDWDSTYAETQLPQAIKVQILLAVPETERRQAARLPVEFVVPISVLSSSNLVAQAQTNTTTAATP